MSALDPKRTFLSENNVVGRQTSTAHPRRFAGVGEGAQFASLALTALVGASLPRASSPCNLDVTDRLTFDLALDTPHTLARRCIGLSLNEAWIVSLSRLVPNSDFQK